VELWQPAPPPAPPVAQAPPPPPKPAPAKPEPRVEKPDIATKEKPRPKPKPEPKPQPKAKPEPKPEPKADPDFERRLREQVAMEQQALEVRERERVLQELLARQKAEVARQQADARARALNEYIARIRAKVRSNWILPADLNGNPEAVFHVVQLPTGEVLSAKLAKSSGNAAYDTAVERAILKSSPLPLPAARELFERELRLTFRPRD
jgi:colicin import membrane protein